MVNQRMGELRSPEEALSIVPGARGLERAIKEKKDEIAALQEKMKETRRGTSSHRPGRQYAYVKEREGREGTRRAEAGEGEGIPGALQQARSQGPKGSRGQGTDFSFGQRQLQG